MSEQTVVGNWDRAYRDGKYDGEAPVAFVRDIVRAVEEAGLAGEPGFYPGCGSGRNFIPLMKAGLRVEGNDISEVAVEKLKATEPDARVAVGNFATMPPRQVAYLLSIQLFQHGNRAEVGALFQKSAEMIAPGGLFCLRVNSVHTQIVQPHDVVERTPEGGMTIHYLGGQKTGQDVHFYSAEEIRDLTRDAYDVVLPLREEFIPREDRTYWVQWETILRKKG